MGIQRQDSITHTTLRPQLAVNDRQFMNQRVRIEVVEVVSGRNFRSLLPEQRGQVGILPVEISNVGGEMALLQQVTTAGQVSYPRRSLLRPGLVSGEPLPERSEGKAWLSIE